MIRGFNTELQENMVNIQKEAKKHQEVWKLENSRERDYAVAPKMQDTVEQEWEGAE